MLNGSKIQHVFFIFLAFEFYTSNTSNVYIKEQFPRVNSYPISYLTKQLYSKSVLKVNAAQKLKDGFLKHMQIINPRILYKL